MTQMTYHPDDFAYLVEAIEDDGGALDDVKCAGTPIEYEVRQPGGHVRKEATTSHACGKTTVMLVSYPYSPDVAKKKSEERGLARVCALGDAVGLWPRYIDAIDTGRSGLSGSGVEDE